MKTQKIILAAAIAIIALPLNSQSQEQAFVKTYASKSYPLKHTTGFVRQADSNLFMATVPRLSFVDVTKVVPKKFSLRAKAGPVEDQGQCGSCWDFSLTTTLRGTLITQGKDPGRLSFNYLLNCSPEMNGCEGGDFSAADHLVSPVGAPKYGADGRYTQSQSACKAAPVAASAVSYKFLGDDGGQFPNAPAPSYQDISYVVGVLHQPVSIDIAADSHFESYSSGVYNGCTLNDSKDINHMVVIEGYDCETSVDSAGNCVFDAQGNLPKGVGRWLVRNSWGKTWGDGGYITMKATDPRTGKRCNAVASDALFFDVK
jgi:C1A family cysteine protease